MLSVRLANVTRTARVMMTLIAVTVAGACSNAASRVDECQPPLNKAQPMTQHARGTFDVKLTPADFHKKVDGPEGSLGRMSIAKQFHGDIEGTSIGEMLTAFGGAGVKGSAGYVAVERVTGSLDGKKGSFILQHSSTMSRGVPQQSIFVVPDSGTDELVGLSGTFTITMVAGKHEYEFAYTLAQ